MWQLDDYDKKVLALLAAIVALMLLVLAYNAESQPRYRPQESYVFDTSAVLNSGEELVCDGRTALMLPSDGMSGRALIIYDLRKARTPQEIDSLFFHVSASAGAVVYVTSYVINRRTVDTVCRVIDFPDGAPDTIIGAAFVTRQGKAARWFGLFMPDESYAPVAVDCAEYQWRSLSRVDTIADTSGRHEILESVDWVNEAGMIVFHGTERELRQSARPGLYIWHNRLIYKIS